MSAGTLKHLATTGRAMKADAEGQGATGTSRTARQSELGFTLIEMMVVLALIAVVTAASSMVLSSGRSGRVVASATAGLVGELTRARIDAIRSGRPRSVAFDPETRSFFRTGRPPLPIPDGVRMELTTARQSLGARSVGSGPVGTTIAFLPDGRSSGGRIEIAMEDARRVVTVNWLTGVITENGP